MDGLRKLAMGRVRLARAPAALAAALLGLLLASSARSAVTVTRLLPACSVVSGQTFQADLVVEVTGVAPAALIVEEELPAGWVVAAATWSCDGRDDPFPPVVGDGRCKWLFDPLGIPVGSGLIRMDLVAVAPPPPGPTLHCFQGGTKWFEVQAETRWDVDGQKELSMGRLRPGWNALSLPFPVSDRESLGRLFCGGTGDSLLIGPVYVWETALGGYVPYAGPLSAGQGFLGCVTAREPAALLVAATSPMDLALKPGGNLTGVCQALSLCDLLACSQEVGPVWQWDPAGQVYRLLPGDGVLLPGYAYWVQSRGAGPLIVPLGQVRQ